MSYEDGGRVMKDHITIYSDVAGKLLLSCVASYLKEAGQSDDVAALVKGFNPRAYYRFTSALAELDRFANSLDTSAEPKQEA